MKKNSNFSLLQRRNVKRCILFVRLGWFSRTSFFRKDLLLLFYFFPGLPLPGHGHTAFAVRQWPGSGRPGSSLQNGRAPIALRLRFAPFTAELKSLALDPA